MIDISEWAGRITVIVGACTSGILALRRRKDNLTMLDIGGTRESISAAVRLTNLEEHTEQMHLDNGKRFERIENTQDVHTKMLFEILRNQKGG